MLIHVIPDDLRQVSRIFNRAVTDFYQYRTILRSNINQIEMNWTGCSSADELVLQFRHIMEALELEIFELDQLGYTLAHQAGIWDLVDQEGAALIKSRAHL